MTARVSRWHSTALAASLGVVAALTAGCANDSASATDAAAASGRPTSSMMASGMPGPSSSAAGGMSAMMNDPSATPASKLTGAKKSTFVLLKTRPPGTDNVKGAAWLAQTSTGTTLTVTMTGLTAGANYIGHLHRDHCNANNGGEHFRFDPNGPATPPNEVHIAFTAEPNGAATATVTNPRKVGNGAKAVVIHPADAMDNRLACADF